MILGTCPTEVLGVSWVCRFLSIVIPSILVLFGNGHRIWRFRLAVQCSILSVCDTVGLLLSPYYAIVAVSAKKTMPHTDSSWKYLQDNLKAARAFAAFLDLVPKTDQVDRFKLKHPDFMSPFWWSHWQVKQKEFQKVWDEGFPQLRVLQVISDVSGFEGARVTTRAATDSGSVIEKTTSGEEYAHNFAYKKALLFLFTESWRAKICRFEKCGRHFIAEKTGNRFHSQECAAKFRDIYKRENWTEHKDELNKRRRDEYASQKKKRPHAKRKNLSQR